MKKLTQVLNDEKSLFIINQFGQLIWDTLSPPDGVAADQDGVVPRRGPHDRDLLIRGSSPERTRRIGNDRFVEITFQRFLSQPRGARAAAVDSHGRDFDLKFENFKLK